MSDEICIHFCVCIQLCEFTVPSFSKLYVWTKIIFNRFPTFIEIIIYRLVGQDEVSF